MKRYKPLFKEDIYGNNAIVYHRTRLSDLINKVYTSGFQPGEGDMYGKGFYSTYDLESQQRLGMEQYGDIIVKFQVSLENFFFFDYHEFLKSPIYTFFKKKKVAEKIIEANFLQVQLNYYGIKKETEILKKQFSSDIAIDLWKTIKSKVRGIIFTGRRDGKVLVCYDTKSVIPLSFSSDNGETFEKVTPKNLEYIKNIFKNKDFSKKEQDLPNWVEDNEPISYSFEGVTFIWKDGTWKDGTWKDGIWQKGTWKKGTWERGRWSNGTWKNGTWERGTWIDGTWRDGIWRDGIWKGGTWEYGTWKDGIWKGGTWKGGTWEHGLWEYGIWESGVWDKGVWKDGIWKGGSIYDPKLKNYVESDVSPLEYFKTH